MVLGAQETWQRPATQALPGAQALLHAPQWRLSLWVFTQKSELPASPTPASPEAAPLQRARVGPQSTPQRPMAQTRPAGQALPQAPQFARSVSVVTHAPLQARCAPGHAMAQAPSTQT